MHRTLLFVITLLLLAMPCTAGKRKQRAEETPSSIPLPGTQWQGRKVALLGDSITDKGQTSRQMVYWQYLAQMMGFEPYVYGINGNHWSQIPQQCERMKAEMGDDVDAIIIFCGTNDYNAGVPLGDWYEITQGTTLVAGPAEKTMLRRIPSMDGNTLCGRINRVMLWLKENCPTKQVILLTPLHRGFAHFSDNNVQPDEAFPNRIGLHIDAYVAKIKEAANVWAVPVIDLNAISGLYPSVDSHVRYFRNGDTDRLHPNSEGHRRMALALYYQLACYPAAF